MKKIFVALMLLFLVVPLSGRAEGAPVALTMPVSLTGRDFVTKVYGLLDPSTTKEAAIRECGELLNVRPQEDEYGLWLESDDGFVVSYYGMTPPDVSAHAAFGPNDHITDYGFFFIFPYESGERETANARQAQFSGTLLQEFMDMGLELEADTLTDALFEVTADYEHDAVDMRLVEEHQTDDQSGRFILILTVNPDQDLTAEVE